MEYRKFEELLSKKGVTAYAVGKATGINPSTFTDWKSGRSKPKYEKLSKIAKYFNVPVVYFYIKEKGENNDKGKTNS